jgi:hypothetical protein
MKSYKKYSFVYQPFVVSFNVNACGQKSNSDQKPTFDFVKWYFEILNKFMNIRICPALKPGQIISIARLEIDASFMPPLIPEGSYRY